MLIVGDPTSSNARRLVEAALAADCPQAFLIEDAEDLAHIPLAKASTIGLSAAASAPDEAIEEICSWLDGLGFLREEMAGPEESIRFRPISVVTTEQAPPHLPKILADDRAAVDTVLMDAIGDCPTRNIRLADAMRYAATAGGKRFRAALALAVAEMLGGDRGSALRVAAAIECVHAQSLVHDDLPCMDDDDLRRGRPTVHRRFDEATAVLAGDALLALAFEILSDPRTHADAAVRSELVLGLAKCIGQDGLAGGQMMDLYPEADLSREGLIDCLNRKTGALVRFAVEAGMLLGRSNAQTRSALKSYATDLGLLFQLRDDLLDSEGDAAIVGKAVNKDKDKSRGTGVTVLGAKTTALEVEALLRACDSALEPFGISAARLRTLARFAARRDL
jgi:geranylgeranyl pyrophosphate synthase